jgi:serine-type D-Ala-D-Ala carboxypeptidase/endopeptidase (penicillin-binding protein 4)
MKRALRLGCFLVGLLVASAAARADLASDVRAVLADRFLSHAKFGVKIVRLSDDGGASTLFQSQSTLPLVPASNLKLITTSAALERLGRDFKFRTLLVRRGDVLALIGDGDPSFGDAELLKKVGWSTDTVFKAWAAGLVKRDLGPVRELLVDDSVFDEQLFHPHWPADQSQKRYEAEVAGMNLNVNCVDLYVTPIGQGRIVRFVADPWTHYLTIANSCVGGADNAIWLSRQPGTNNLILRGQAAEANDVPVSVTVHDPPLFAGNVLAERLDAAGIQVGSVRRDRSVRAEFAQPDHGGWTLLAVHETPLLAVMARANKDSMNLYAECCCKRLGFAAAGVGSWENGVSAVGDFLQTIGVPTSQFHLDDGCGLSKENAISANLMVTVLEHDFAGRNADAFLSTLAVAGIDGTMDNRFRGTDLRGRVFAKSGFVNGVSCLSGYLHARDQRWYAFSILLNDVPAGGTAQAKILEEKIVKAIDDRAAQAEVAGTN